jgi:CBS domain containing-hemolysin-like protein
MISVLLLYLLLALGASFLCSLLEAALLSIPRPYIGVLVEKGTWVGKRLSAMKDNVDRPLAAILTLNTIAHTVGAVGVGAEAQEIFGPKWTAVVGAVVTLLILLFSEIIPKTLGAVHNKRLAGFTAWSVHLLTVGLYPLVLLCEGVSRVLPIRPAGIWSVGRRSVRSPASAPRPAYSMTRKRRSSRICWRCGT